VNTNKALILVDLKVESRNYCPGATATKPQPIRISLLSSDVILGIALSFDVGDSPLHTVSLAAGFEVVKLP